VNNSLFIGIPTWNSERFIKTCIESVLRTTANQPVEIVLMDNGSRDGTVSIARDLGCRVVVAPSSLPDALNALVQLSSSEYTLLMHADTILLADNWFDLCCSKLQGNTALVSPQDIGCGPYSRPWGSGKPESSFMLFRTRMLKDIRITRWVRHFRLPWPQKIVDFYTHNVTHRIPEHIARRGLRWEMMQVHTSRRTELPIWQPSFEPICWTDELAYLEYGLGNFYSLDGTVTHYHNWFERLLVEVGDDSSKADLKQGGIPSAYINVYTRRFLHDYTEGKIGIPIPAEYPERTPVVLPTRAFQQKKC
jgi:glycosyltransferase involved in cell wall biosynthesis